MRAWDAALSFKRGLFLFSILQLWQVVVVAPEWNDAAALLVLQMLHDDGTEQGCGITEYTIRVLRDHSKVAALR